MNLEKLKNAQLATSYSSFSSKSMCKTITVDGEWKGVRGGKCGKPISNSLSFSITKSVATKIRWMLHPHTLPAAAGQCYSYIIATDWMDGQCDMRRAWWGVCGRRRDGPAGASPSSPRSPLSHHAVLPHVVATHGGLSGAGTRTDGRATRYAAALADCQRSTAHKDDAAAVLRTVPRCN